MNARIARPARGEVTHQDELDSGSSPPREQTTAIPVVGVPTAAPFDLLSICITRRQHLYNEATMQLNCRRHERTAR